jgi:protein TonB
MNISSSDTLVAVVAALLVHAGVAWCFLSMAPIDGAKAQGEGGVTVGLGMAGAYMDAAKVEAAQPDAVNVEVNKPQRSAPLEDAAEQVILPAKQVEKLPFVEREADIKKHVAESRAGASQGTSPLKQQPEPLAQREIPSINASKVAEKLSDRSKPQSLQGSKAMKQASGRADSDQNGGSPGDIQGYFAELMAWLNQHKDYPAELKKQKQQGTVTVKFTIDQTGKVLGATVKNSSGIAALDHAALDVLKRASPLPAIPAFMKRQQLTLAIPIDYALRTK